MRTMKTYNESQIIDVMWDVLNCTEDEKHETIKLLIERISKLQPCSDEKSEVERAFDEMASQGICVQLMDNNIYVSAVCDDDVTDNFSYDVSVGEDSIIEFNYWHYKKKYEALS
jgi:hypothetical protein